MWIFMNDSFVSIVEDRTNDKNLMVRARRKGDIERAFPGHKGTMLRQVTDYAYRASIPRQVVADATYAAVRNIHYDNFKDSIPKGPAGNERHSFYLRVWSVMQGFQRRRKRDLLPLDYTRGGLAYPRLSDEVGRCSIDDDLEPYAF